MKLTMKFATGFFTASVLFIGATFAAAADLETRNFPVGDFSEIENRTPGSIELIQGPKTSVTVQTETDLFDHVEVKTKGDRLILSAEGERKSFFSRSDPFRNKQLHFTITTPNINAVSLNGSGDLTADNITTDSLKIDIHGSGNASVDQIESGSLDLSIAGSGKLKFEKVKVSSMDLSIHGSGSVDLGSLQSDANSISIHGSGDVDMDELKGERLNINIHGAGDIDLPKVELTAIEGAIHGSGDIKLGGKTDTLEIRTHGAGNVSTEGLNANKIVIK